MKSKDGQWGLQTTTGAAAPRFRITGSGWSTGSWQAPTKPAAHKRCSRSHPVTWCFMKHLLFYGNCRDYTDTRSVTANYTATRERQPLSCCKDSGEARLLLSHQEGAVITTCCYQTQPPSTCAHSRARPCVTLTSTSKVRGTSARVSARCMTQPSLLKRQ